MAMNNRPNLDLYGLIGYPVKHSMSPAMHNAAFQHAGVNAEYRLFEVAPDDLEDFLGSPDALVADTDGHKVRAGDIKGFNVTIPHKVRVKEIVRPHVSENDQVDAVSMSVIGAVNTVRRAKGKMFCYNTDMWGFQKSLEIDLGFSWRNKTICVLGCGGAGRAIIAGLTFKPTWADKIFIYDTNSDAVQSVKDHFARFDWIISRLEFIDKKGIEAAVRHSHLLVNSTPVGMRAGDPSSVPKSLLHKDLAVYDVVYNRQTQLLRDAVEKGIKATDGKGMLAYQGARAWGLWLDRSDEPCDLMKNVLEKELQ